MMLFCLLFSFSGINRLLIFAAGYRMNNFDKSIYFDDWLKYNGLKEYSVRLELKKNKGFWEVINQPDLLNKNIIIISFNQDVMDNTIDDLANGLKTAIKYIRKKGRNESLYLVGHSLSGIIARNYIVNFGKYENIKKFMSISSPHLGMPIANIYKYIPFFDKPLLRDLIFPENDNKFLFNLNRKIHPKNIKYISIVSSLKTNLTLYEIFSYFYKEKHEELIKEFFYNILGTICNMGEESDGLIPVSSQKMSNIYAFKKYDIKVDEYILKYSHSNVLPHLDEFIYLIEDKPDFSLNPTLPFRKELNLKHNIIFINNLEINYIKINGEEVKYEVFNNYIKVFIENKKFINVLEIEAENWNGKTYKKFRFISF